MADRMCYHLMKNRFQIKWAQNEAVLKEKSFMLFVFRNEVKRFVYKYIIALKIFEFARFKFIMSMA